MNSIYSDNNENKATIIGGHGFIGRALNSKLTSMGWSVWVPEKDSHEIFEKKLGKVFYCAGLTSDYLQRPFDTVNAHVNLLSQVLYQSNWERLVYLSSTRVYDGLIGQVDESNALSLNPNNQRHLYDLSKLMGESLCLQTTKASVARLSCVYENENDEDGFLPNLLRQVFNSNSDLIDIQSSPNYSRDYVHLSDVLTALIAINNRGKSTIYNVASGENVDNQSIFSLLEKYCKIKIRPTKTHNKIISPQISIRKISDSFGWNAKKLLPTIENILQEKMKVKNV